MPGYLGDSMGMNRMSIPRMNMGGGAPINIGEDQFQQPQQPAGPSFMDSAQGMAGDIGQEGLMALLGKLFPNSVGMGNAMYQGMNQHMPQNRSVGLGAGVGNGSPYEGGIDFSFSQPNQQKRGYLS